MNIDGYEVNTITGEIIGKYEVQDVTPVTQEEKDYYKYTSISPVKAQNKDQVEDYISACVDKRKLVVFNNTKELHNMSCGESNRNNSKMMFTLPQYKTMNKLIKGLQIANVIVDTKANIAKLLGCTQGNIKRTLAPVSSLVVVETEGVQKGFMRILIHPAYGYKHESSVINKLRNACVKDWVSKQVNNQVPCVEHSEASDVVFSEGFEKWLDTFYKQVAGRNGSYRKEELGIETEYTIPYEESLFIQDYYNGTSTSVYSS